MTQTARRVDRDAHAVGWASDVTYVAHRPVGLVAQAHTQCRSGEQANTPMHATPYHLQTLLDGHFYPGLNITLHSIAR